MRPGTGREAGLGHAGSDALWITWLLNKKTDTQLENALTLEQIPQAALETDHRLPVQVFPGRTDVGT